jgi:hypothetical protein
MGASASTNVSEQVNRNVVNAITDVIVKSQTACAAGSQQDQSMTIGVIAGEVGSISQNANSTVSASCIQKLDNSSISKADITAALKAAVDQTAQANPTLGASISTNVSNITNENITNISNKFSVDTVKTCIAAAAQKQQMEIGAVLSSAKVGSISQVMDSSVVANCIQSESNVAEDIKKLTADLTSEVKQSAVSGLPMGAIIGIIIAVIVVVLAGLYIFLG